MKKERNIGDEFKFKKVKLKVVKEILDTNGFTCTKCYFYNNDGCNFNVCSSKCRTDKTSVNFIKLNTIK